MDTSCLTGRLVSIQRQPEPQIIEQSCDCFHDGDFIIVGGHLNHQLLLLRLWCIGSRASTQTQPSATECRHPRQHPTTMPNTCHTQTILNWHWSCFRQPRDGHPPSWRSGHLSTQGCLKSIQFLPWEWTYRWTMATPYLRIRFHIEKQSTDCNDQYRMTRTGSLTISFPVFCSHFQRKSNQRKTNVLHK